MFGSPLNNLLRQSLLSSTARTAPLLHTRARIGRNKCRNPNYYTTASGASGSARQSHKQRTLLGIGCGLFFAAVSVSFASRKNVHLDAPPVEEKSLQQLDEETIVDPATSIAFPKALNVPAKIKIPTLTLIGVGVRTVSFLRIKVYSVGFYADLSNPNLEIPINMSPDDKIKHIVENTACVIRIVPTRSTSYSHLRDAFMRALQSRMTKARADGTLTEEEAIAAGSPMRKLKTLFPNTALAKHTSFDIFLTPPMPGRPRSLVFRDLGAVESDWVATELVLHYFEGDAPSPALKKRVAEKMEPFTK